MANKIDTTAELRAQMKKNGVRLPHGYTVVKRAPVQTKNAKKAVAKKSAVKPKKAPAKAKQLTMKFPAAKKVTKSKALTASQKKFAANSKRAAQLVKTGKAKDTKAAWKIIKTSL